jgi:RNA polymerase sigma factor (sigma-70 family)
VTTTAEVEELLRRLAPRVLAALVRRYDNVETAEDAVQEALLAAADRWPEQGLPERPDAWLITVAARRMVDQLRSERAARRREEAALPHTAPLDPPADQPPHHDDTLRLLLLCCHPALTPPSQVALTLRAVGGLTTAEIARAFLVPEATMAQRLSRARQRLRDSGARFDTPPDPARLPAVLHVLYLIFNEGYTATSGADLARGDLTRDAVRLTRTLHRLLPADGEVAGLLALMLLTEARRPARTRTDGSLVPLAEQDRSLWRPDQITEGTELVGRCLATARVGPYQLQAAIAAVHAEAGHAEDTDWRQIVALYQLLAELDPSPVVPLNQAVAVAMADGPEAGLALLAPLDQRLSRHHRMHAVRAHLLELAGDHEQAVACYRTAARLTTSLPEQRYLNERADRLG